ncbi:MAG: hypothetical protein PVI30_07700 [Myxococcales bacterium]|jgi:hypothetical protein
MKQILSISMVGILLAAAGCEDDTSGSSTTGAGGMTATGAGGMTATGAGGMTATGAGGMTATGAGGMTATGAAGGDATAATWTAVWENVIVATGCNGGPLCHGGLAGGMLVMLDKESAYEALVNQPAEGINLTGMGTNCADTDLVRVVPGDPDNSLLVQKVENPMPACGGEMPPNGMLAADQIQLIRDWVAAGAMND